MAQPTTDSPSFTLFTTFHKAFVVPAEKFIKPIQAGKATSSVDLGFESDDQGDNISALNPYFSELTVLYYIWKNYSKDTAPYWGLCHYRRYFTLHLDIVGIRKIYYLKPPEKALKKIFTPKLINRIENNLKEGKVIVPLEYRFIKLKRWSVKKQYIKDHDAASWAATEDAIQRLYPEYVDSCNKVMNGLTSSWYNMMIGSWDFWNEYLDWLFAILFDVKKTLEAGPDPVPLRIYGNISERLMNVYLHHKKKSGLQVAYLPVVNVT